MCLTTVDHPAKTKLKPQNGIGYKVFTLHGNRIKNAYCVSQSAAGIHEYELNTWYESSRVFIPYLIPNKQDVEYYISGYHTFLTEEDAYNYIQKTKEFLLHSMWQYIIDLWKVYKIEYDRISTSGTEHDIECLVVDKMRIIEKVDE